LPEMRKAFSALRVGTFLQHLVLRSLR